MLPLIDDFVLPLCERSGEVYRQIRVSTNWRSLHIAYSSDYTRQKFEFQICIATNVATKKENQNANQGTVCILERRSDEADER